MSNQIISLNYDVDTGFISDRNGLTIFLGNNVESVEPEKKVADTTIEMIKQGVSVDDIIKLKNMELL